MPHGTTELYSATEKTDVFFLWGRFTKMHELILKRHGGGRFGQEQGRWDFRFQ